MSRCCYQEACGFFQEPPRILSECAPFYPLLKACAQAWAGVLFSILWQVSPSFCGIQVFLGPRRLLFKHFFPLLSQSSQLRSSQGHPHSTSALPLLEVVCWYLWKCEPPPPQMPDNLTQAPSASCLLESQDLLPHVAQITRDKYFSHLGTSPSGYSPEFFTRKVFHSPGQIPFFWELCHQSECSSLVLSWSLLWLLSSLCGSPGSGSTFTPCSPSSYPDGIPVPSLENNPLSSSLESCAKPAAVCVALLSVHPGPICITTDANLLGLEGAHTWAFC